MEQTAQQPANSQKLAPGEVPRHEINWGSVVKGALLITGIAVVGVGGFYAASALATAALEVPAISATAVLIGELFVGISGLLGSIAGSIYTFTTTLLTSAASSLGIAGGILPAASASSAAHTAGLIGAGASVAAATKVAIPTLNNLPFTTPADIDPAMQAQQSMVTAKGSAFAAHAAPFTGAHAMHDATHAALESQHNSTHRSGSFVSRLFGAPRTASSHTDAVRASQPTRETITPRNSEGFASAINSDREKLEASLGQKII